MVMRSKLQRIFSSIVALLSLSLVFSLSPALAKPKLLPKPQKVKWLKGEGAAGPLTVITINNVTGSPGQTLYDNFLKKLPKQGLGSEGYLLEVSAEKTVIITPHTWGYLRAQQTLKQLRDPQGNYTYCQIADWPTDFWRGAHFLIPNASAQPAIKKLISEVLVPLKCNVFLLGVGYSYQFPSHPEIKQNGAWSKQQMREIAALCQQNGIIFIPEMGCLGHQSWGTPPHALLRAYPDFEEPSEIDPKSSDFYCRSWCPLHPQVNSVVFDLIDDLLDACQSSYFHVGLDEVFVIASEKCPRCRGKDPADLFAKAVNDLYGHITTKRRKRMLMWGDRLLSSARTPYGAYASSANGTDDAIDMIPKDIIICDWHYSYFEEYPSLRTLTKKGFHVWPAVAYDQRAARAFQYAARSLKGNKSLGTLSTTWCTADNIAYLLSSASPPAGFTYADKARARAKALQAVLAESWNPD